MKRTLPERKPARIRWVEKGQIVHPAIKPRAHTEDVDDYIFGGLQEKTVSDR